MEKSYLLLKSDDPEAANSAFFVMHKGNASRRSREQAQMASADTTGEAISKGGNKEQATPQRSMDGRL